MAINGEAGKAVGDETKRKVQRILDDLDFDGYEAFIDVARVEMEMLYGDGAKQAARQLDVRISVDALELVNEHGVEYARDRAAEMVGMKQVHGGMLPNPNAKWRIDEGTREMLRSTVTDALEEGWSNDKLADALADSYAFSDERAEMIARTETARADVEGNLAGYRALGVERKQWLASEDACEDCEALDGEQVGIDDSFGEHGGFGPPAHPHCRCDLLPVLEDE